MNHDQLTVGPYSVALLETCRFGLDGGAMFGVVPRTLWQKVYAMPDDRNRIPMAAKVLLLRSNDRTILVDTGNCPWMSEKLRDIYDIRFDDHSIEASLAQHGIDPSDVTDVILTHLHFDHVGGATLENGDPRFPNARYYVQQNQLNWARKPKEKDRASFMPEMFEPLVSAGLVETLDGDGEVLPGVFVESVFGHTQGMQTLRVSDGTTTVLFPADLMPTSAHITIPYGMAYDNFPLTTIEEKRAILPRIIDEKWIVIFEHDALRDAASLTMGPKGPVIDHVYRLCR
jgi:glyoxylase-like metal-dependent hydrolase (beta-lactamase superfamily II)